MEAPITQPARQGSSILNFLVGLVCVAMIIAFGVTAAVNLGYIGQVAPSVPIPPPTPIIRVVAPAQPAAPLPVEQPVRPAVVAPAVQQPVVAPAPVEQPTAPATRQIIIVKNGNDPAAAPIVIDRGTKRKTP